MPDAPQADGFLAESLPAQAGQDALRCAWARDDARMAAYHDTEWGVPEYDSQKLFAKLVLDGFQAGLSWRTILYRRDGFMRAFDNFEPRRVARYTPKRVDKLLQDPGIIRHRGKIEASIRNAQAYLALEATGQTFADFLWAFVDGTVVQHQRGAKAVAPTQSAQSVAMHKSLKKLGFSFCGPTICYAFMQAVGMVNDHALHCPRYQALTPKAR